MQKISDIIPQLRTPNAEVISDPKILQELKTQDYWLKVAGINQSVYMPSKTAEQAWGKDYEGKKRKLPDFARFRLAVRFKNQKYAYYPSYDYNYSDHKKNQVYDEQTGLEKLLTMQAEKCKFWYWDAISIFVNITDKWADRQKKIYNYRFKTWMPNSEVKIFMKLHWYNGRLDLDYMQMYVAQENIKGYSTAEERAPWDKEKMKHFKK